MFVVFLGAVSYHQFLCSVFGLGCVYTWRLIDFPDCRNTSHLSCFLCLSFPTEGPPLWMKFSPDLWTLGSAFVYSPVTTNNSWIAVNVSAAVSPPSPLWTIGLHSACTNRTLSWELHYQLFCIWYLRYQGLPVIMPLYPELLGFYIYI